MTFEKWWVDRHGINWKAYYTDSAKEAAEEAWQAATLAEREACAEIAYQHEEGPGGREAILARSK